jgi:thiol-disulfide isomerase/thioredoxin
MSTGAWVLVIAVAAPHPNRLYPAATDGRFGGTRRLRGVDEPAPDAADGSVLAGTPWADQLGERATLLQFSSAFCAPCRVTRRVLSAVADSEPGVGHIEVDAEQHLDLVRRLGILRTPTTIVLDASGHELVRAAGAPTKAQVLAALAQSGSGGQDQART